MTNSLLNSAGYGDLDRALAARDRTYTVYAPNGQPTWEVAKESIAREMARSMGRGWSFGPNASATERGMA